MKFYIETLGCKVNAYESAFIKDTLMEAGFKQGDIKTSDVVIINTCSVTNQADAKSRKVIRQARRNNQECCLVVCGCAAQNHQEKLIDEDIDILIGNKNKSKIVNLIQEYLRNNKKIIDFYDIRNIEFEDMRINSFENKTRAFVKIQDGCNNFCSYCIIPFMRGNIRSKDFDVAVEEINCLANNGYQEVVLTGIHTGSYGKSEYYDLVDLIKAISTNPNLKRIRISSIEITELNDKFMEELKCNEKICNHFHIPIQSGSDHVLKLMNRKYDIKHFKTIIARIRSIRPDVNITTDLIVGFPEESDADFKETLTNLKTIGFSKIHTFPFSMRAGTKAATLKPIQDSIKHARTKEVLALSDELQRSYNEKFLNQRVSVLVENRNSGYTDNYLKVILDKQMPNNTFVDVIITEIDVSYVKGHVL